MKKLYKFLIVLIILLAGYFGIRISWNYDHTFFLEEPTYIPIYMQAEFGDIPSQFALAVLYELKNALLPENSDEWCHTNERTLYWLKRAMQNGDTDAKQQIKRKLERNTHEKNNERC